MGKQQNTFEKRRREVEKKQRAEEKRKRRLKKKEFGPTPAVRAAGPSGEGSA